MVEVCMWLPFAIWQAGRHKLGSEASAMQQLEARVHCNIGCLKGGAGAPVKLMAVAVLGYCAAGMR